MGIDMVRREGGRVRTGVRGCCLGMRLFKCWDVERQDPVVCMSRESKVRIKESLC